MPSCNRRSRSGATSAAIVRARASCSAAQRNRDIQRARFEGGTGLGLEVIDAQRALARARLALAQALIRYNVEQLRLVAATGHLGPDVVPR